MLLTFRLTMIVPLLISAVCVEGNSKKLSFVPSEENKALAQSHRQSSTFLKETSVHDGDSNLVEKRHSNKNNEFQDSRLRRGSMNSLENGLSRTDGGGLAHKMAKDALKSPEMQETIRKLSRVGTKRTFRTNGKVPGISKTGAKAAEERRHQKRMRHNGRRKKKRKRHHQRHRKQRPGLLKRGSFKRTLDSERDVNALTQKSNGRGNSMIKRNPVTHGENSRDKSSTSKSTVKVTGVKVDENDYVDFSTTMSIKSTRKSQKTESLPAKLQQNGKMVERLMRTTTKDPSKKNSGDQGVEYSDYYSDDEILQDIAANKIPMQLVDLKNPNDRFARQAVNFTSYRDNQIDRNLQSHYPDNNARRKEFRYNDDSVNYLNDFQNYPTIERSSTLNRNSRLFGADDPSLGYATNYKPLEQRSGNPDAPYSANVAAIPEQSQVLEGINNLDTFDPNKLNDKQQPVVEAQNPDRFHYLNQYETSQEHFQSSNSNEPQSLNVNEPGEPQVRQSQNTNNYQQIESNLPREESLNQSAMNQPQIDNAGMPDAKEKDTEVHTQFNYSPLQLYNLKDEQELKNFPAQSVYNIPAVKVPNAMDQPLGKILESLGINVNGGLNNVNQNENLNENINQVLPYSDTYANGIPMEHFISPGYLKKKQNNEQTNFYEDGNTRGLEYPGIKSRNRNKVREGYSRQSNKNGIHNDDILSHMDDYKDSSNNTNISIVVHDTKEVANQILDTIMEELEELKEDRSKKNKREGLPCRLSGSWSTAQAGMKLDMRVVNRTIIVTLSDLASPHLHESFLNGTWNVSGHVPFKRGSPFTLIATNNYTNSIAVFVGACRVCQGIDTIAGVWSVARQPKGCKDFQVATSVFNDIFRKTKLSSLKENQGTNSTKNATIKHRNRKS
ncbi:uncharacterized protein DDB_G0287625 [Frieseomelitta varia]|uniref:uncharacterized protein DDB_G0287625 n=1 Tax=Frieseomelitta varia TaxID=561572 RepID=UPI001CB69C0E|nr:uncharacterized protein DDB_G0287625 [Frieseomelitta varia]